MELDVDGIETTDEVDESLLALVARNVLEEVLLDRLAVGKLAADGDQERERLGVDVADLYSSLVREEDHVALSDRVDANVELGIRRVGEEGLDDEVGESASGLLDLGERVRQPRSDGERETTRTNLDLLACALLDPGLAFCPALVQETASKASVAARREGRERTHRSPALPRRLMS